MFQNIRSNRLSDEIVSQIQKLILEQKLKPGDRLPPEIELADQFSVSRASVREAFSILETQGLIERRKSGGTSVKHFSVPKVLESIIFSPKLDRDMFQDFMEARQIIEIHILSLAVERAEPEDIRRVESTLLMMENDIIEGNNGVESDILFHQSLAACTKNQVLISIIKSISDMLRETRSKTLQVPGRLQVCLQEHRQILDALRNKDVVLAQKRMFTHLTRVVEISSDIFVNSKG